MKAAARLRQLMKEQDLVLAPGGYDGITARLIEQAGFSCLYMTGAGTSAALGFPDLGLLTMTEMVDNAGTMARSVSIPLIADADTGYGNELNVTRTVREFEARNVAAIHIEDQVFTKRCGHLDDKEVITSNEYVAKIRAAVAARRDPDFMIIARTDARAVHGLDEAIDRANAALEAGADMAFVEAPQSLSEMAEVPRRVRGPCLLNMVPGGRTPIISAAQAQEMGYRLMIMPGALLNRMLLAGDLALQRIKEQGGPEKPEDNQDVRDFFRRFGSDEWNELRHRFQSLPEE
ncbi:isocitrate lyase/PEP mutase family protein [Alloalcanivorax xenomutans]|uniref:isocitrate lyase/PEP mutase family protein n=1 Tax=Alloalcanivorax xenomutans TaxID=1094342 RepID=UPI002934ABEE|nr:isocitrate lyase/PEP mutase family protein [Alloalcanivorax xenomutans]WOD29144.1 isocitrate lyase/PEP mutase family protein [Alloalcanivorax xenomutans]